MGWAVGLIYPRRLNIHEYSTFSEQEKNTRIWASIPG